MDFAQREIIRDYQGIMFRPETLSWYGGSQYFNVGLWSAETPDQRAACDNLMASLVALIPGRRGPILEVGCGKGETTRYLGGIFEPSQVTGINISDAELAIARQTAPGCNLQRMDATALELGDAEVEHVISVEAAFHFNTRAAFLREALRVLRPGGSLVLADILIPRWATTLSPRVPQENFVEDPAAYVRLLEEVGFEVVSIQDVTPTTVRPFTGRVAAWAWRALWSGRLGVLDSLRLIRRMALARLALRTYLFVSARKPR